MSQLSFPRQPFSILLMCGALFLLSVSFGCSAPEKEKTPVVPVQVTPVRKAPIEEVVSAEAVVFPVQQAVVMPKISSTIKEFAVQRGSRVKKGQLRRPTKSLRKPQGTVSTGRITAPRSRFRGSCASSGAHPVGSGAAPAFGLAAHR